MRPIKRPNALLWLMVGIILISSPTLLFGWGDRHRPASPAHRSLAGRFAAKPRPLARTAPNSPPCILPSEIKPDSGEGPRSGAPRAGHRTRPGNGGLHVTDPRVPLTGRVFAA